MHPLDDLFRAQAMPHGLAWGNSPEQVQAKLGPPEDTAKQSRSMRKGGEGIWRYGSLPCIFSAHGLSGISFVLDSQTCDVQLFGRPLHAGWSIEALAGWLRAHGVFFTPYAPLTFPKLAQTAWATSGEVVAMASPI